MNNPNDIKQYIILRTDANTVTGEPVSAHKLAVMTAHASMAFLAVMVRKGMNDDGSVNMRLDDDTKSWLQGTFTKVLLKGKMKDIKKAINKCDEMGLVNGEDYFIIEDACYTELVPDEGRSGCIIGIGFRPMNAEAIRHITKKFQLYT